MSKKWLWLTIGGKRQQTEQEGAKVCKLQKWVRSLKAWIFKNAILVAAFAVGSCLGGAYVGHTTGNINWTATASMLLVAVTLVYVLVAWVAINDARKARVEETMPQVALFFDLDPQFPYLIYLVLENFGRRPAHNITVSSSPPLRATVPHGQEFFAEGIKFLAPGQALRPFFDTTMEVMAEKSSVPKDYKVKVEWDDGLAGQHITGHQPITLRDFQSITWTRPSSDDPLERIAKELENITRIVNCVIDDVRGQE